MNTLTVRDDRANLYRLIDKTATSHEPIVIAGKRNNAVLVSQEGWSAIQETLFLLVIPPTWFANTAILFCLGRS